MNPVVARAFDGAVYAPEVSLLKRTPERPSPNDVFVPSKVPLGTTNAYASREQPEASLDRYVRRGQTPVVFGEYGVGKTTLVRRYFAETDDEGRLVYIPTAGDKSISDVFRKVLEQMNYRVSAERITSASDTIGGGLNLVVADFSGSGTESETVREEFVVTSPTDDRVLQLMAEKDLVLVIDEMHKAAEDLRSELADLIKAARGLGHNYPVIVLVGTTMDAEQLVRRDPGIDRFVKELGVPPMTDEEARSVIEIGFERLGLDISDSIVETIVRTAAGAPTIVQEICLNIAEAAVTRKSDEVIEDDYIEAVRVYLNDHGRRLASTYVKSIEQTGAKRYRKQVLIAMATAPHDFVNLEDVRSRVSSQLGEDVPPTALSGPLRELKSGPDSILQDVERQSGSRVYNLNAFRDPMMKSFIRFMAELEEQGLLPRDRMRELETES